MFRHARALSRHSRILLPHVGVLLLVLLVLTLPLECQRRQTGALARSAAESADVAAPFAANATASAVSSAASPSPVPSRASAAAESPCPPPSAADDQGHGFDLANLDRSVAPCDNFYQFADGGWLKANPVPPAYSRWGTFNILHDRNEDVLHQILEDAAKDKTAQHGSNWQKIGDFYATCMDEAQIESVGLTPLQPEFRRIAAVHDGPTLQAEIARLQREGVDAVFDYGPQQDFKDSSREIASIGQAGLALPDRDY